MAALLFHLLALFPPESMAAAYAIDPARTKAGFYVKYAVVNTAHGEFTRFHGSFDLDKENQLSGAVAVMEVASVKITEGTPSNAPAGGGIGAAVFSAIGGVSDKVSAKVGAAVLDADFVSQKVARFAANNPEISFISKKVWAKGKRYTVMGDLTVMRRTKKVILTGIMTNSFMDKQNIRRVRFHAEGRLKRKDFGLTFSPTFESGGLIVDDDVTILLDVEGILKK